MNIEQKLKTGNLTRRELLNLIAKGTAAATLSNLTIACGGSPTGPSPNPGNGGGNPTPTNVNFAARANETFTGQSLGVDYVLETNGTKHTGRTDRDPIQIPTGTYTLKIGINTDNQRTDATFVPSIYENFTIGANTEFTTDLASYDRLFSNYNTSEVIQAHRGRNNQGVNKRWATRPSKFIIWDDGTLLDQPTPKNNAVFDNYVRIMREVDIFTDGLISTPTPDEVQIIRGFPPGTGPNQPIGNYEVGSYNSIQSFRNGVYEWQGEQNNQLTFSAPWSDLRSTAGAPIAEAIASTQGGDNSSDIFRCIYDNKLLETPVDKNWGKFNNRLRKTGEIILHNSATYNYPHEIRLR